MAKQAKIDDFYGQCLSELKARANWSESFIPILDRYVIITNKLSDLTAQIVDEQITVEHTNKNSHTNKATSPHWRMFLLLNREATLLGNELKLTPKSAPILEVKEKKKGFELGEMKVTKTA